MGKSTTAAMFRRLGVPVFDSDAFVHKLQVKGGRAVGAIEAAFPGTTNKDGVDRTKLAAMVLGYPNRLLVLESILHPLVHRGQKRWIQAQRRALKTLVVLDIPLLFETGSESQVHYVVVVSASAHIQRVRVLSRLGMTEEKFRNILAQQTPDRIKRRRADFVIPTGAGKRETWTRLRRLLTKLKHGKALSRRRGFERRLVNHA